MACNFRGKGGKHLKIAILDRHPLLASTDGSLQEVSAARGLDVSNQTSSDAALAVFVDWHPSFETAREVFHKLRIPTVLVVLEPAVVVPQYLSPAFRSQFSKVIMVGRPSSEASAITWPTKWDLGHLKNKKRLDKTVAMSSRKFSFSKGSLYWLREKAYDQIPDLTLFGYGWDVSNLSVCNSVLKELLISLSSDHQLDLRQLETLWRYPRNYLGRSDDKLKTLSGYKYSLVIENSLEYCSEKLIDSLLAGTLPIYVGPNLESFLIPKDLVLTAEPSLRSILAAHEGAMRMDWGEWHKRVIEWLSAPTTRDTWEAKSVNGRLLDESLKLVTA